MDERECDEVGSLCLGETKPMRYMAPKVDNIVNIRVGTLQYVIRA